MMKIVNKVLLSVTALVSLSAGAAQYEFVAADQTLGTQLCLSAVQDRISEYKKNVRKLPMSTPFENKKHQVVANKQKCNDINIVKFARKYKANDTARFIGRFLERNVSIRRDTAENTVHEPEIAFEKKVIVISGR